MKIAIFILLVLLFSPFNIHADGIYKYTKGINSTVTISANCAPGAVSKFSVGGGPIVCSLLCHNKSDLTAVFLHYTAEINGGFNNKNDAEKYFRTYLRNKINIKNTTPGSGTTHGGILSTTYISKHHSPVSSFLSNSLMPECLFLS